MRKKNEGDLSRFFFRPSVEKWHMIFISPNHKRKIRKSDIWFLSQKTTTSSQYCWFFSRRKIDNTHFFGRKIQTFFHDISRSSNQLCFLQANSAILTYGAPKAMFFGWCTRSIFFLLPAKLDSVSWLKGAICDDEQDGTWVVAWPPTNLPSLASNRIKIFASKW